MKNIKRSLGVEAASLTFSKILTMVIGMAISMLLARFRTLEEYGTYSQMLLIINLACALLMLGLPNSINYFLSRAETDKEKQCFLSVYYTLSTILSVLIGVVLVLSVPLAEAYFKNSAISQFYYFLALTPWTTIIISSIENVLIVYHRTRFLVLYRLIVIILNLIMITVLQWLGYGFRAYMIGTVILNAITAISVYFITALQCGGLKFFLNREMVYTIFKFSIPLGLSGIVGTLCVEFDKLMIGKLMTTEQMAIYTNAAKELPVTIVSSSITAVLMPQIILMIKKHREKDAIMLWGDATLLSYIFIAFIATGVFTYAEDVVTFLYSNKYIDGVNVFRIYTMNLLFRCTYFGIILNSYGKNKSILLCSVFSLLINILLNPLLFSLIGMSGPAIATFLSIVSIQFIQLFFTAHLIGISFCSVFPWRKLGYVTGVNIVLAICFYILKKQIHLECVIGSIMESIILGLIWGLLYLIIMRTKISESWRVLNSK